MPDVTHRVAQAQVANLFNADTQSAAGPGVGELVDDHPRKGQIGKNPSKHGSVGLFTGKQRQKLFLIQDGDTQFTRLGQFTAGFFARDNVSGFF